ncbi:aldo/keto reductase [Leptobacterium flavescens]|uniref:Aldo/keto reductase n=1 Tax=Leptobacterium flavescens TaxID=472055 RepID=A0A6P0UHM4_9FLAO|nr:aldo/keto reductase [Leptobacterium flavescens]NER12841.1 aldo/keto reductase [Leptobacterium flavescens]
MQYRKFGKLDWKVSEVGYGMWGIADWSGADDKQSAVALDRAVEMGCNFFDTAWAYGSGKSEQILAELLKRHPSKRLYLATKIPPKDQQWPPVKGTQINEVFPAEHIIEYTEKSLKNLGVEKIDLMQFHVWEDDWAQVEEWQKAIQKLKTEGKIEACGISVNRWEPENCIQTLETGLIDAIQVIYNVFDQSPEDVLFPYCRENDIALIARVPFDEGSLTGKLSEDSKWPEGDFRNIYFGKENLAPTVKRVEELRNEVPQAMSLAEMSLRFIASNPDISTMIPGMRQLRNVEANMNISDGKGLNPELTKKLKEHRWDRVPTHWSC